MHRQDLRVLVASENPDVRELFKRIVLAEEGTVVLGEAENAAAVIVMSQNNEPDVVLPDSTLPDTLSHVCVPFSQEAIYFGGIGLVMGGVTLFTIVFAPVGVVIAAVGACSILFGLTSKLLNRLTAGTHLSATAMRQNLG